MKWVLHTFLLAVAGAWGSSAFAQGTSTFDGVIFRDLNGNGTQDAGEEGIPGVLVELRGGATATTLNASVLTKADGSYSLSDTDLPDASNYHLRYWYPREAFGISTPGFTTAGNTASGHTRSGNFVVSGGAPLDETLNLGLEPVFETLSFSAVRGLAGTNWGPENLTLPQTPSGYGVLKEVKLYINYHVVNPSAIITNNDGTNPGIGSFQTGASFTVPTPFDGGAVTPGSFTYQHPSINLSAGQSTTVTNLHHSQGGVRYDYDASNFNDFIGGGTFDVPFSSNGASAIILESGNVTGTISTQSAPGIFVVYIYEENSLPVRLASFSARAEAGIGILNWSTTEETNSFAFEVERSTNGKKWAAIGTVAAKGESDKLANYTFPDAGLTKGVNYYRLKMIDRDGSFNHSHLISLKSSFGKEIKAVTYPNPTSEAVFLQNVDAREIKSIDVIGTNGRALLNSKVYDPSKGIDVRDIPNGLYLVRYTLATGEQETVKVIVRH